MAAEGALELYKVCEKIVAGQGIFLAINIPYKINACIV
jgi:hypothetical protein